VKSVVKKRDVRAKDAGDAEKSLTTDSTDDTDENFAHETQINTNWG